MIEDDRKNILDEFLKHWPTERVTSMELSEYVDVGNKDTFCQWLETKTRILGSIKGGTSYKFGIFKRKRLPDDNEKVTYFDDGEFTWVSRYGQDRDKAFEKIRYEILQVISFAMSGEFEEIDDISLSNMFKWKIAFLYSNERLIPIYEKETIDNIGEFYSLRDWNPRVSQVQRLMIAKKPTELDVYSYMEQLWYKFNSKGVSSSDSDSDNLPLSSVSRLRRPTKLLNTDSQFRSVARSGIVEMKHNKLQQKLYDKLVDQFGEDNVLLEEDFVDIKLLLPEQITLYEVKSSPYAGMCIREAIGQLLFYSCHIDDPRKKRLVVVGQYPLNESETRILTELRNQLKVDLSYMSIELN